MSATPSILQDGSHTHVTWDIMSGVLQNVHLPFYYKHISSSSSSSSSSNVIKQNGLIHDVDDIVHNYDSQLTMTFTLVPVIDTTTTTNNNNSYTNGTT
eukprot:UN09926